MADATRFSVSLDIRIGDDRSGLVYLAAGHGLGLGRGTYTSAMETERAWSPRSYSLWPGPMGIWTVAWLGRSKPT